MESWLVGKTVEGKATQTKRMIEALRELRCEIFLHKKGVGFVKYDLLLLWICFMFLLFSMCLDKMQIFPGTRIIPSKRCEL